VFSVHRALYTAYLKEVAVSVSVLEVCDPSIRKERGRFWNNLRRQDEIAGGRHVLNSN
jgi:hypothetical protein